MSKMAAVPALARTMAIVLSAVALAGSTADAAQLSKLETRYVTLRAGGMIAERSCWGLVDQSGTARNFGRKTGIDVVTLDAAIMADALRGNKPHKATDLIPEVTDRVNSIRDQIARDVAADRSRACLAWDQLLKEVARQNSSSPTPPARLIPLPF